MRLYLLVISFRLPKRRATLSRITTTRKRRKAFVFWLLLRQGLFFAYFILDICRALLFAFRSFPPIILLSFTSLNVSFTKTPLRPTAPLKKTGISHHQKRSYTTIILSGISVISLTVFGSIIFAQSFFTNVSLASLIDGVMPSMSGSILTVDPPKPINFLLVGM